MEHLVYVRWCKGNQYAKEYNPSGVTAAGSTACAFCSWNFITEHLAEGPGRGAFKKARADKWLQSLYAMSAVMNQDRGGM